MLFNIKNALVLAPHTDDGELGAGAFINKMVKQGINVDYVAFSAAEESVPAGFAIDVLRTEVLNATNKLGIPNESVHVLNYKVRNFPAHRQNILDDLITIRKQKKYDLVLIPATPDIHQDHFTVCQEAIRAFKQITILGYELIWNHLTASSTCFMKVGEGDVNAKIAAMAEYKSQQGRDYCSADFIRSLARTRGVQIGAEFAECFEVIRLVS